MPLYRLYFVDTDGQISKPAEIIEATDDKEAMHKARQYIDGVDLELWDEARLVARFPHHG